MRRCLAYGSLCCGSTWTLNVVNAAYGTANQRYLRTHGYFDAGDLLLAALRHCDAVGT